MEISASGKDPEKGKIIHQHLIVKAYVRKPPFTATEVENWLRELVADIKMNIIIGPHAKYVDAVGNAGATGVIGIETSHAAVHVWVEPDPAMLQMDVYSCSCFEMDTVINKLKEFDIVDYEAMMIDRNGGFFISEHRKFAEEHP